MTKLIDDKDRILQCYTMAEYFAFFYLSLKQNGMEDSDELLASALMLARDEVDKDMEV